MEQRCRSESIVGIKIAIVLRGDRGLEHQYSLINQQNIEIAIVLRGDRGLELYSVRPDHRASLIAIVLRGDRGLEQTPTSQPLDHPEIAIVLRGDRGLEQQNSDRADRVQSNCDRSSGRSRIGTRYHRESPRLVRELRSFFGAIEDWNLHCRKSSSTIA